MGGGIIIIRCLHSFVCALELGEVMYVVAWRVSASLVRVEVLTLKKVKVLSSYDAISSNALPACIGTTRRGEKAHP